MVHTGVIIDGPSGFALMRCEKWLRSLTKEFQESHPR